MLNYSNYSIGESIFQQNIYIDICRHLKPEFASEIIVLNQIKIRSNPLSLEGLHFI